MIFTGHFRGWWAHLPFNSSCTVCWAHSHTGFPLFLCLHACLYHPLCSPLFLCHRRRASTVHNPFFFAFQPPVLAGSENLHMTYVFRLFSVCGCNVILRSCVHHSSHNTNSL